MTMPAYPMNPAIWVALPEAMAVAVTSALLLPISAPHQTGTAFPRAALRVAVTFTALGEPPPGVNVELDHVPTTTSEFCKTTGAPSTLISAAAAIALLVDDDDDSPTAALRAAGAEADG